MVKTTIQSWQTRLRASAPDVYARLAPYSRYAFMLLITAMLIWQVAKDWDAVRNYPWQLNWLSLGAAFLLYTVSLALTAYLWQLIIHALSGVRSSFWVHLRYFCLSNPARRLPTPVWYMGARAVAYQTMNVPKVITVTASVLEMITMNLGALVVVLLTLGLALPRFNIGWALAMIVPALLLVLRPSLLIRALNAALRRLKRSEITVELSRTNILLWMALASVIFVNGGFMLYAFISSIYALPADVLPGLNNAFGASWLVASLAQLLFFIPNTAIRQLSLAYLLSAYVPLPVALASTLILRLGVLGFETLWALIFARLRID